MNRAQRHAHARLWPFLTLALIAAYTMALLAKANIEGAAMQAPATLAKDE